MNLRFVAACAAVGFSCSCASVYVEDEDDHVVYVSTSSTGSNDTSGAGGAGGQGGEPPLPSCDSPLHVSHDVDDEWWDAIVVADTTTVIARYVVTNDCDVPRNVGSMRFALLDDTKPSAVSTIQLLDADGNAISIPIGPPLPDDLTATIPTGAFAVPAHEFRAFDVHTSFSSVLPSNLGGLDDARSGDRIRITLDELRDAEDALAEIDDSFAPPSYLLRASAPTVSIEYEMDPLTEGINTIFRAHISNLHPDREIGLRQIVLQINVSNGLAISDENLNPFLVNGMEIPQGIFAEIYEDEFGGTAVLAFPDGDVVLEGSNELTVELQANVIGVTSGAHVVTFLTGSLARYPANMQFVGTTDPGLLTMLPGPPYEGPPVSSSFMWTDFAEGPIHIASAPSSYDYYSNYLISSASGASAAFAP